MTGLDEARFREVLGHFATGITVVTALEEGEPVGFTCQSFAALSLDPPMVILAPRGARRAGRGYAKPPRSA